jgi:hypothetical protein
MTSLFDSICSAAVRMVSPRMFRSAGGQCKGPRRTRSPNVLLLVQISIVLRNVKIVYAPCLAGKTSRNLQLGTGYAISKVSFKLRPSYNMWDPGIHWTGEVCTVTKVLMSGMKALSSYLSQWSYWLSCVTLLLVHKHHIMKGQVKRVQMYLTAASETDIRTPTHCWPS